MPDLAPSQAVASFDSATAMLRATARALRNETFPHLGRSPAAALPVRASSLVPTGLRRRAYAVLGGVDGIPPRRLGDLDMDAVAEWVVGHYDRTTYPGAVVGSANGAAVHLCAATGMPFLPQTLLVPVRWADNDPDRPDDAMVFGGKVAPPLLERNPAVVLHHMHDGNQDRLMVSHMTYFRLKWTHLPQAYARFLTECLAPGGPVVVLADESSWPTTRVAERHVFQTGAQGGLGPEEYLNGSARVERFLREQRSPHRVFQAPRPDGTSPEAEWGFEPTLGDDLADWAANRGRTAVTIRMPSPQALSAPVAELVRTRLRAGGAAADRLLVESFAMLDATEAARTGSVPYWSFFPVEGSLDDVETFVAAAAKAEDPYRDVDVLMFPHGVASVGATPPGHWTRVSPHITGRLRFVDGTQQRWPAHFDSLTRYAPALRQLPTVGDLGPSLPVLSTVDALRGEAVSVAPTLAPT